MTEQNETGAMHQQHGRINRAGEFTPVTDAKSVKIAVQDDDTMPARPRFRVMEDFSMQVRAPNPVFGRHLV